MTEERTSNGVNIQVDSFYLPEQSQPEEDYYVFGYRIKIENRRSTTVQLMSRYWLITDADGSQRHVRGPGVVGEQPILEPGEHFEYSSGAQLETPIGTMQGTYYMKTLANESFEVEVPCFSFSVPGSIN